MLARLNGVLAKLALHFFAVALVLKVHLARSFFSLLGNQLVHFKLLVDFLLCVTSLRQHHFPALDVVRSFVLVGH